MSPKTLKIALAVSVAVNLFAIAGAGSVWTMLKREEAQAARVEARPDRPDRPGSPMAVIARLSPEGQALMRDRLRATALAARPDFEQARERRGEAITAAGGEPYNAVWVTTLLEQSRAAERRGRDRLEAETIRLLAELSPADRAVASELLNRRGKGGQGRREERDERPEPRP